jgi:hypothetical protein
VILDPDVYPMDTAWYTGVSVKKHELHEQIAEEEKAEAAKQ